MRISDQSAVFLHLSMQLGWRQCSNRRRRQMVLAGKIAVLVGSGPNINAGIGYGLADAGAAVVCCDVNQRYGEACAEAIARRGGRSMAVAADIVSEPEVERAVAAVLE